jgi:sterol 3beta-glucosyltransferase
MPGPMGDQPIWARRLQQLEVSAATIAQRRLTAERLSDAIRTAVTNHQLRYKTEQLAELIDQEDGAAAVLATVESLLDQSTI